MRQIVLDTETTGLEADSHYVIEIGCVELVNRKPTGSNYHQYIRPERAVGDSVNIHGITDDFLVSKPRFAEVMGDFLDYIAGVDELIIHNASFDIGFLNKELQRNRAGLTDLRKGFAVLDTLAMAKRLHPGQKNNLDALCKRYGINNEHRELHGALLDAEILADVYLAMTGGQTSLSLGGSDEVSSSAVAIRRLPAGRKSLRVVTASALELAAHRQCLSLIDKKSGGACLWKEDLALGGSE